MKKLITLLLILMLVFSATACNSNSGSNDAAGNNDAGTPAAPADDDGDAAEDTGDAAEPVADGDVITLRLGSNHAEDFPTSVACLYMADLVKERTNGRIVIECYFNAVLGDEKSLIEQTQFGGVDIARINISPMAEFVDDFNALQMPYIYTDSDHYWRVLGGDIGMGLLKGDEMRDAGFLGLNYYDGGARSFYNSVKEIRTPEDMVGLKIRVQESSLMMGMVSSMGAAPTPMTYGEVYSALQTGVVDGAENSVPQYLAVSHYEVAPYMSLDEHTRAADMTIMSMITVEKLDPADVEIIEQAALDSCEYQKELWIEAEAAAIAEVESKGATVSVLTPDEQALFREAVQDLLATEGAKYQDLLDAIAAA